MEGPVHLFRPSTEDGIASAMAHARSSGTGLALRGAGQSYGDAAFRSDATCLDLSRFRRVLDWNPQTGRVSVEPGVTIGDLWRFTLEDGWWPPVVPGTSFASLGGAAAMNVHGKNNWKVGPIGDHIQEFEILLPNGDRRVCNRERNADLFHSAIGGFGMLGVFLRIDLQMKRVHSGHLRVNPLTAGSLGEMIQIFDDRLDTADYLVGWVDCFPGGSKLGRGVVHEAFYLPEGEDPCPQETLATTHQLLPDTLLGVVPKSRLWFLMQFLFNAPGMRSVNLAKYLLAHLEAGHGYEQPHAQFSFLLDFVPDWRWAYGRTGMIQYQSFLPAETAERGYRKQLELAQSHGLVPLLGVFKRHRRDDFRITHGVDGFSLALEFKLTPGNQKRIWELARAMDRIVLEAGGRFYFAKDSTLCAESYAPFMEEERVRDFRALKAELDPEGLLQTDLAARIGFISA